MSPADPALTVLAGTYAECGECHAPECDPVPPRFPVTVRGRSPHAVLTLHLPDCRYLRKLAEGGQAL